MVTQARIIVHQYEDGPVDIRLSYGNRSPYGGHVPSVTDAGEMALNIGRDLDIFGISPNNFHITNGVASNLAGRECEGNPVDTRTFKVIRANLLEGMAS
jgi:hypothetical protein